MSLSTISGSAPVTAGAAPPPRPEIRSPAPAALRSDASPLVKAQKGESPAPTEVESALKTLNDYTAMVAQDVSFTMDEESGKTIVKVVDTATQEILRQFPSAEALSIARSIDKMQGLLIREKA